MFESDKLTIGALVGTQMQGCFWMGTDGDTNLVLLICWPNNTQGLIKKEKKKKKKYLYTNLDLSSTK